MATQQGTNCEIGALDPLPPNTTSAPWQRALPFALPLLLLAFLAFPRVHSVPALVTTFLATSGALLVWAVALLVLRRGTRFAAVGVRPLRSHYIQASVQFSLYAYWGWYWRDVYAQAPLIVAQLAFLYALDALIAWSRGRTWRVTCGPLPIILSTNVFLWFKDDWFVLQFALIAVGALGKEFVRWTRDGRSTHIFNPSAFTLSLFALALIVTGTTNDITWAGRIADSFSQPPQIYLVIFMLGLVVQHCFSITLMTLSAVFALVVLNLTYTWSTGTYFFIFSNLPAPVFLGLHLLVTDPSTSPRTNVGRIVFGTAYGSLSFIFYGVLSEMGSTTVYDKLLPVPLLNLAVIAIDRISQRGALADFTAWETRFSPRKLNAAHMACWASLFAVMIGTGYVQARHEGGTYQFWRAALDEGRHNAGHGLVEVVKSLAREGSPTAWNELGMMYLEGELVERNPQLAAKYFGQATKLGNAAGAANLVTQFLMSDATRMGATVELAFERVEQECAGPTPDPGYFFLLGLAHERGRGRPLDLARALELYRLGAGRGSADAKQALERIAGG